MTVAVFILSLLGAMALGMPIAFALLVCAVALMVHLGNFDAQILAQNVLDGANNYPLMAVPFFMLAGELMNAGGLSKRIIAMAQALVGHVTRRAGLRGDHRRAGDGEHLGLGGGRHRGARRGAGPDDAPGRLQHPARVRADRRGRDHRADHPAVDPRSWSSA